jgi:hypothetical protein
LKRFHAEDADDRAENIRLLKVEVDKIGCLPFHEVDRLRDVNG